MLTAFQYWRAGPKDEDYEVWREKVVPTLLYACEYAATTLSQSDNPPPIVLHDVIDNLRAAIQAAKGK
jgi:hypothetical protein